MEMSLEDYLMQYCEEQVRPLSPTVCISLCAFGAARLLNSSVQRAGRQDRAGGPGQRDEAEVRNCFSWGLFQ